MPERFGTRMRLCAIAAILTTACASRDADVQKHAEKMESLRATIVGVADAWLNGYVSGAFTRTALEQTFELVDQERAAVAATPEELSRPGANAVARHGEQLARVIAALSDAVRRRDASRARRHLADLPRPASGQP
jgi:hypothetical protein